MAEHPVDAAISEGKGGIYLNVHAQPGARKPQLRGMHGDAVKIAVAEAAQDGKANRAILRVIARGLGLGGDDVVLASGASSRRKRVFLKGDPAALKANLRQWLAEV